MYQRKSLNFYFAATTIFEHTKTQRDWFKVLLTKFADDWNSQGDDELDDGTEDIDPNELILQMDETLENMTNAG